MDKKIETHNGEPCHTLSAAHRPLRHSHIRPVLPRITTHVEPKPWRLKRTASIRSRIKLHSKYIKKHVEPRSQAHAEPRMTIVARTTSLIHRAMTPHVFGTHNFFHQGAPALFTRSGSPGSLTTQSMAPQGHKASYTR